MNAIKATWKNGHIVPLETPDWPEGTELLIEPVSPQETIGLREEDWPDTPEKIAAHLALMDQIEPLIMSREEEAEWQAARQAQKEFEKAIFIEHAEKLRRMWE
jgi:hypothetical protein